jgi:hypothetical protein
LIFHDGIGANSELPDGPSVIPHPSEHAYSVPDRSTPRNTTTLPLPSNNLLPDTCKPDGGGEDAATVAVLADVAVPDPPAFVAVTTTSIVSPTSEAVNAYDEPVAPEISAQPLEHRCH